MWAASFSPGSDSRWPLCATFYLLMCKGISLWTGCFPFRPPRIDAWISASLCFVITSFLLTFGRVTSLEWTLGRFELPNLLPIVWLKGSLVTWLDGYCERPTSLGAIFRRSAGSRLPLCFVTLPRSTTTSLTEPDGR